MLKSMNKLSLVWQIMLMAIFASLGTAAGMALFSDRKLERSHLAAVHTELSAHAAEAGLSGQMHILEAQRAMSEFALEAGPAGIPYHSKTLQDSGFAWAGVLRGAASNFRTIIAPRSPIDHTLLNDALTRFGRNGGQLTAFIPGASSHVIFLQQAGNGEGTLIGAYPLEQILSKLPNDTQAVMSIYSVSGTLISSTDRAAASSFSQADLAHITGPENTGVEHLSTGGDTRLVAANKTVLAGSEFIVVSERAMAPALAATRGNRLSDVAVVMAIVAIISVIAVFLARLIVRPLNTMARSLTLLSEGDTDFEVVETDREDAIGQIAKGTDILRENRAQLANEQKAAEVRERAIASSSTALSLIDLDGTIIEINDAMAALLSAHATVFGIGRNDSSTTALRGRSVYSFLKNPGALRDLVSTPERLPRAIDLPFDALQIEVRASCLTDENGTTTALLLEWEDVGTSRLNNGLVNAINEHKATIEFDMQGNVLHANDNFCSAMGYTAKELVGMKHSRFMPDHLRNSPDYAKHWKRLARGEQVAGKFQRVTKDGREIWMEAAYNPIRDTNGVPYKVVKFASDVTEIESLAFDRKAVMDAISRAQSVFEIDTEGRILSINKNLMDVLGRCESDTVSRSISDILAPQFVSGPQHDEMWTTLSRGEADSRTYLMIGTNGEHIHLQGAITPVLDRNGNVFKYIACLADISDKEEQRIAQQEQNAAMARHQAQVVDEMRRGLTALANGDLTHRIECSFGGEYDALRQDFNTATQRLQNTLTQVVENTDGIRNDASEISGAAEDLSRRTESQAATLEQTSSALEQLTASVKSAAEGAAQANRNVSEAQSSAEESGKVVDEAIQAMSEIENSSRQISRIIGVIDDIAFQTNLLALNAGVEAARAGDAGRGFAVVASEVRALALRSSEAAKEIKSLISTSSDQVGSGVELVGQTGKALKEILGSVTSIAKLVSDIASTAREQSVGIGEINTAVNEIDQVTQQNAAMVEESTAASHSLMEEAEQLAKLVAQFHVGTKASAAPVEKASPAPTPKVVQSNVKSLPPAPTPPAKKASYDIPPVSDGNAALSIDDVEDWDEF